MLAVFLSIQFVSLPEVEVVQTVRERRQLESAESSQRNGERQRSFGIGESIGGLEESHKDREHSTGEFSTSLHVADRKYYSLLLISIVIHFVC